MNSNRKINWKHM